MTYAITILPTSRQTADQCHRGRLCAEGRNLWELYLEALENHPDDEEHVKAAYRAYRRHSRVLCKPVEGP